jgi:hypothetical protein
VGANWSGKLLTTPPMEKVKREFVVERHEVTSMVIYEVTGEDLEQLEKETLTVGEDFSFALASLSVAASFTITLSTVNIPAGKTYEVFWIVLMVSYLAAVFFGIRWYRGRKKFRTVLVKIRNRGGALGEEGKAVIESTTVTSMTVEKTTTGGGQ